MNILVVLCIVVSIGLIGAVLDDKWKKKGDEKVNEKKRESIVSRMKMAKYYLDNGEISEQEYQLIQQDCKRQADEIGKNENICGIKSNG